MSGELLIINADDWGRTRRATDSILACTDKGGVTSASAMVLMSDSERAAKLAERHALPLGLHLNLTEPYEASAIPPDTRDRQERLARFFRKNRWRMWTYQPHVAAEVRACIHEQVEAFRLAYGREPSHINGHHHVHTSPNVLLSGSLAPGLKVRRTFTFLADEKPLPNRLVRIALNRVLAHRFVGTAYFFHLHTFVRVVQERAVRLDGVSIEVLTHPEWSNQRSFLMSDLWRNLISGFTLGSYDLL